MSGPPSAADPPSPSAVVDVFSVYEVQTAGEDIYYFGVPKSDPETLEQTLQRRFSDAGYEVRHFTAHGEDVLRLKPQSQSRRWSLVHPVLFVLTVLSTLFAGALWFHVDVFTNPTAIWQGWPFAASILLVLGIHELGHYAVGRHHDVPVTLPYFIPIPTVIGTMGAVIRLNGRIPNRRALFDIGVAGPLAGAVATVLVSIVGLSLGPISVPPAVYRAEEAVEVTIGYPPLMELLAWALDAQLYYEDPRKMVHPIVIGGWVGMFVTFLNMIPVGQLDGGHIVRALFGESHRYISWAVPVVLFALAGWLLIVGASTQGVTIWLLWGLLTGVFAYVGAAEPLADEPLDTPRQLLGAIAFGIALLCFAPVPIAVSG